MSKPYDHLAIDWTNDDGLRECRVCPTPITGWGETLRHIDEAVRPAAVTPADKAAVDAYVEVGARALAEMWTDVHCTDLDRALVVVRALYQAGGLNTKKRRRVRAN